MKREPDVGLAPLPWRKKNDPQPQDGPLVGLGSAPGSSHLHDHQVVGSAVGCRPVGAGARLREQHDGEQRGAAGGQRTGREEAAGVGAGDRLRGRAGVERFRAGHRATQLGRFETERRHVGLCRRTLVRAGDDVAHGDLGHRIADCGPDEVGHRHVAAARPVLETAAEQAVAVGAPGSGFVGVKAHVPHVTAQQGVFPERVVDGAQRDPGAVGSARPRGVHEGGEPGDGERRGVEGAVFGEEAGRGVGLLNAKGVAEQKALVVDRQTTRTVIQTRQRTGRAVVDGGRDDGRRGGCRRRHRAGVGRGRWRHEVRRRFCGIVDAGIAGLRGNHPAQRQGRERITGGPRLPHTNMHAALLRSGRSGA